MNARVLAVVTLVAACGSPSHPATAPGSPFGRALSTCKHMVSRTGGTLVATFERELNACKKMVPTTPVPPPAAHSATLEQSWEVTIRVLSTDPFLFQHAEPGTRAPAESDISEKSPWSWREISRANVDAKVAALPFGAVAKVHYQIEIMNSDPPPYLSFIAPAAAASAEAALLADWHPDDDATDVQVYADGHAFVRAAQQIVDVTLSQAEFDEFFASFARAGFEDLPHDRQAEDRRAGRVVLLCGRYRQVDLEGHAQALAPVVAAFEHIRARALAQARPRRDAGHEPAPGTP